MADTLMEFRLLMQRLPDWLSTSWEDDLVYTLLTLKSEEEVLSFLYAITTSKERLDMTRRWRAAVLLYEGFNTVDADRLTPNISKAVISRANTHIVKGDLGEACRTLFERLKRHRRRNHGDA